MGASLKKEPLERRHSVIRGGNSSPVLLVDETVCYRIRNGTFDIFAVANSAPDGRRHPLFSLGAGEMLFALAPSEAPHVGLLAVGSQDSVLEELSAEESLPAAAVESWIRALTAALQGSSDRSSAIVLAPGPMTCVAGDRLAGDPRAIHWLRLASGRGIVPGTPLVLHKGANLPLNGDLHLLAETDLDVSVEPVDRLRASDLSTFQRACQAILWGRIKRVEETAAVAPARVDTLDATLRQVAGLGRRPEPLRVGRADEPLHAALGHIFDALKIAPVRRAFDRDLRSRGVTADRLAALLTQHRLLSRTVLLRAAWETLEGPPLLAYLGDESRPVALIYRGNGWVVLDGDTTRPVDAAILSSIAAEAMQIYPTLPVEPFRFRTLFEFGLVGGRIDGTRLLVCLVVGSAFASLIPLASRTLIDDALPHSDLETASIIVVGLFISVLARTVFEAVKGVTMLRSELRLETRLQPALIARMMNLPTSFYRAYSVGDIMDRVLGIQRARQLLSSQASGAMIGAVFSLVSLVPILIIDWRLALVALVLALALGATTSAISIGELRHERRRVAQKGKLDGFVLQILMGIAKLRASAAEPKAFERWVDLFRVNLGHTVAAERWANIQRATQALMPEMATIALYGAIVYIMKTDAETASSGAAAKAAVKPLSAGVFVALSASVAQVFGAITGLADALTQTLAAVPLIERAKPIIATELDAPSVDTETLELTGDIDVRNLVFRYAPSSPPALNGLDLRIAKGQFVAIVGASGCGKSTLLRLLLGFERPERGDIFYDGVSIRRLAVTDLRRQMGVVLQHGKLFSGSIHHNIVGQSGRGLDEAMAAARLVGLDADIEAMPMGLHTVLLDGAATLSGGQRQRILIARALVGRPGILLLDEATSALDNKTQAIVTETLAKLAITRIVIAHRLSTIEAADTIVVLDRGKVVESGSFAALMAAEGPFAAHARRQMI